MPFRAIQRARFASIGVSWAAVIVMLLALVTLLTIHEKDGASHAAGSDGLYSWIVARSIVFDHDLHYANDYALCGDPWGNGIDRGGGRPDNPFYVGPALYWVPVLWIARAVVRLPEGASPAVLGGCHGPLAAFTLRTAPVLGGLAVLLFYRIAKRFARRDGTAVFATAMFVFGSNLVAYETILPSYSHVYATFTVAVLALTSLRAFERGTSPGRWVIVALAIVACVLQRSTSVSFAVLPAGLAAMTFSASRQSLLRRALPLALVALGALTGTALMLAYFRLLYGSPWVVPQGENFVHLGYSNVWLVLFGIHGGLFFTVPLVWLSVAGAVLLLRDRSTRWVTALVLFTCFLDVYVSSMALDWDSACTYGARRLTTLIPFFPLLAVRLVDSIRAWCLKHAEGSVAALGVVSVLPFFFWNLGAVWALPQNKVPLCSGPSQEQLYGQGAAVAWGVLDQLGDLAVLPAVSVFSLRYGFPLTAWREITRSIYNRDFKTLAWRDRDIKFGPPWAHAVQGMSLDERGAHLIAGRSTFAFTASWRFATQAALTVTSPREVRLRVGQRSFWGWTHWYGWATVEPGSHVYLFAVPPGGFDSGLQELVFDVDAPGAGVVLERLSFDDVTPRSPIRARGPG